MSARYFKATGTWETWAEDCTVWRQSIDTVSEAIDTSKFEHATQQRSLRKARDSLFSTSSHSGGCDVPH
ncbi:hypothetical protein DPMN_151009 [Dreissena polymorpha]|uniref:Uncharacterized protein n=1 Tax=Dreissena polymorpha TaxID=45954 RepID=A0A9D4FHJ3_DREPO|nr:hypothetical protein DPMN_151009 [Dreissena polymorpha]